MAVEPARDLAIEGESRIYEQMALQDGPASIGLCPFFKQEVGALR
jgi:hypothetical protein